MATSFACSARSAFINQKASLAGFMKKGCSLPYIAEAHDSENKSGRRNGVVFGGVGSRRLLGSADDKAL